MGASPFANAITERTIKLNGQHYFSWNVGMIFTVEDLVSVAPPASMQERV
jgi:hypothetical protein